MPPSPFEKVRITLVYADGRTEYLPVMARWYADWLLANEVATGYYRGRRVVRALISAVD